MEINIILSKHADDKRILNGLTKEDIKNAIKFGSKIKQTEGYLSSYLYIKVAYKKLKENVYFVKTVYVDRR